MRVGERVKKFEILRTYYVHGPLQILRIPNFNIPFHWWGIFCKFQFYAHIQNSSAYIFAYHISRGLVSAVSPSTWLYNKQGGYLMGSRRHTKNQSIFNVAASVITVPGSTFNKHWRVYWKFKSILLLCLKERVYYPSAITSLTMNKAHYAQHISRATQR